MKRIFAVALGILTAIGGFLDIGDIVTNAVVGSRSGWSLAWVVVVPHCLTRVAATQPPVRVCEVKTRWLICRGTVAASQQVWF